MTPETEIHFRLLDYHNGDGCNCYFLKGGKIEKSGEVSVDNG